jgi:hypothetical protein
MTATLALILDAYREMNAKRLFWIVMVISGVIVAAFAGVGLTPTGITIFGWQSPLEFAGAFTSPANFYKLMYYQLGINLWITWAAMVLAVISTAGIFPDFLAGGAVELYLARPISRLRLFLVKYACGLLFVILQVSVFSLACFIVIGLRGGVWEPGLLLAIPLASLLFSYLFGVCALVGMLTRSTMAALLVTLIFWGLVSGIQRAERLTLLASIADDRAAVRLDREITLVEDRLSDAPTTKPADDPPPTPLSSWTRQIFSFFGPTLPTDRPTLQQRLADLRRQRDRVTHHFDRVHQVLYWFEVPLPKTTETVDLLQRNLIAAANLPRGLEDADLADNPSPFRARQRDRQIAGAMVDQEMRQRSAWWIIGDSIGFEIVAVGLAAWLFCRRDY